LKEIKVTSSEAALISHGDDPDKDAQVKKEELLRIPF
jgi:hypothetical protein